MRHRLFHVSDVVCDVSSTCHTVAAMAATEKLYPELKNSSDRHLATLHNFPSSISLADPVCLQDTTLDRRFQSPLEDP
jgi:hypothetical protein